MDEYEISGIENIARGVCIEGGRVLLCRAKDASTTYLPGGHIEFGETGREALVREIKEEMGIDATAGELLGVVENSFMQHGKRHCEINLVYRMSVERPGNLESKENWISFEWCDIDKLDQANLLPAEMKQLCTQNERRGSWNPFLPRNSQKLHIRGASKRLTKCCLAPLKPKHAHPK